MSAPNPKVDAFVARARTFRAEIERLRAILLGCGLDEELKWGKPCYLHEGKNVAIVQPFKAHCALLFFKGALIEDPHGLLRSQGANTRSAMRLEVTDEAEIDEAVVRSYVELAVAVEQAGLALDFAGEKEPEPPAELTRILAKDPALAAAFRALTPGRRRGYLLHFNAAKQSKTRTARIERSVPAILEGKGPNDR